MFLKNIDIYPTDYRAVNSQKTVICLFSVTAGKVSTLNSDFAVLERAEVHPYQKGFKTVLHSDNHMKKAVIGWICSYDGRKKKLGNIFLNKSLS